MITRRAFIVSLTGSLLAAPLAARAQQPTKVYRIGFLLPSLPPPPGTPRLAPPDVDAGLRDLGYVPGQNVVYEVRYGFDPDALTVAAEELVRSKVDLLYAWGTTSTIAARRATTTLPIVLCNVRDPVGQGFVNSLAHPGGNVTGLSETPSAEIAGKLLELLTEAVPRPSRIAVVWNSLTFGGTFYLDEVQKAASALKVGLRPIDMHGGSDFGDQFETLRRERITGAVVLPDPTFWPHREALLAAAAKERVAVIYGTTEFARVGGFMAYGSNSRAIARRSATFIDRILRGAKPGDLPVEQPAKLELLINLKTAKALGLTIPPSLLARADEVIQ